jgi:modification methylase
MRSDWLIPVCGGPERLKGEDGRKAHPTQKPEALLHRVLLASTKPGDLVLDPFFGTGTTGAVAKRLKRRFIGIESDPAYVRIARERISLVESAELEDVASPQKRDEPRVPFGTLVEMGLLKPGEILFDQSRRWTAKVRADGTLITADFRGSIHRVAAQVQGASACNGWAFWFVERKGSAVPIDWFRQQVRAEIGGSRA